MEALAARLMRLAKREARRERQRGAPARRSPCPGAQRDAGGRQLTGGPACPALPLCRACAGIGKRERRRGARRAAGAPVEGARQSAALNWKRMSSARGECARYACRAARPRSAAMHTVCAAAGALVAAVEELRAAEAAEATLRAAAEASLREAAAAFKAELFDKTEQLEALRAELQRLRAWQGRAAAAAAGAAAGAARAQRNAPGAVLPAQDACSSGRGSPDRSRSPGPPRPRSPLSLRRSAGALLGACAASPAAARAPSPGAPARGGAQARRPRAPRGEAGAHAARTPDGLDLEAVEGFWRELAPAPGGAGAGGWLPPCAAGPGAAALAAELAALGIDGAAVRAPVSAEGALVAARRSGGCASPGSRAGAPWPERERRDLLE